MISLATDLVLNVVQAADKSRAAEAHHKLSAMSRPGAGDAVFRLPDEASAYVRGGDREGPFGYLRLDPPSAGFQSFENNAGTRQIAGGSANPSFAFPPSDGGAAGPGAAGASAAAPGNSTFGRARVAALQASPEQRFEAFLLQKFVSEMLPGNAESFFGKGNAGEIWKSLLAEQLGEQIAQSGVTGIAERLSRQAGPAV